MRCDAIQYNTIQCMTMHCNTKQNNTMQYNTIQHNTTQYNTMQYNTMHYNTMRYDTIQHNTTQHNTYSTSTIMYDAETFRMCFLVNISKLYCFSNQSPALSYVFNLLVFWCGTDTNHYLQLLSFQDMYVLCWVSRKYLESYWRSPGIPVLWGTRAIPNMAYTLDVECRPSVTKASTFFAKKTHIRPTL